MAEDRVYTGTCACGKVSISLDKETKPVLPVICHCNDCTKHNMSPIVGIMGFPMDDLTSGKIRVQGQEHLKGYATTNAITRHFW